MILLQSCDNLRNGNSVLPSYLVVLFLKGVWPFQRTDGGGSLLLLTFTVSFLNCCCSVYSIIFV